MIERDDPGLGRVGPPIQLHIAHSLGGVIAVDMATAVVPLWTSTLVTFGSQSSLFLFSDPRGGQLAPFSGDDLVQLPASIGSSTTCGSQWMCLHLLPPRYFACTMDVLRPTWRCATWRRRDYGHIPHTGTCRTLPPQYRKHWYRQDNWLSAMSGVWRCRLDGACSPEMLAASYDKSFRLLTSTLSNSPAPGPRPRTAADLLLPGSRPRRQGCGCRELGHVMRPAGIRV